MKLRWYKETHYTWQWDSRDDVWYKAGYDSQYVLQSSIDGENWENVPFVHKETSDPKPKE